ncbi:TetR/AcrR family transcriptional regulator [Pseudomonas sp. PMCC200344]|uniref:TetR/AcrR family transcriptional regulator n=1 Tax=Pseudomonas sp. PMCC200344 TaxID=3042028 RepID=UPI0024B39F2C|nr:TetR/AcrR family transcriptional regulator [Pseudomonas sp. PMCC200344]
MTKQETRDRLIELIKEHQLEHGLTKLAIGKISEMAGISRQTFFRSYADLKPYCLGQSITSLLGDDAESTRDFLAKREEEVAALQSEIEALKKKHKKELEQAITNRVTSLMNSDILAFEANEVNSLLINQSQNNEMLKRKLTEMELKQTRSQMASAAADLSTGNGDAHAIKNAKNFLVFALDMTKANLAYKKDQNFDNYENAKDLAIQSVVDNVKKFPNPSNIEVHLFQERYISTFDDFVEELPAKPGKVVIAIQLPVFSQEELGQLLSQLKLISKVAIHIPFNTSGAIVAANKKFLFRDVPEEEFIDAAKAKTPQITWGFDEIRLFGTR